MDMANQIVKAEGVQKEDSNETLSSLEATVAVDASTRGKLVLAAKPEPSTTGKRKRGRPRKAIIDETIMGPPPTPAPSMDVLFAPLALPAPPPPVESSSATRRRRGTPKKAYNIKLIRVPPAGIVHMVGPNFTPFMLTVPVGRDIIQELLAYIQEDNRTVVPLTTTGAVSSVTFHSSNPGGDKTTYEGRYVINALQGSLNRKYGLLSLWMTDPHGQQIGGSLAGPLIASNLVQIIFFTFEDVIEMKYKRKQHPANASAAAAAQTKNDVDDGELVDIPVYSGEMVESNTNGSSPGPEGLDEGEPIMASPTSPIIIVPPVEGSEEEEPIMAIPITIVPPAEGSEEEEPIMAIPITILPPAAGSEEEEPIMASPITIVPPASSLPEGSDEEEPIMASPITIVPPASSLPGTPDDQNESADICGSDPEK